MKTRDIFKVKRTQVKWSRNEDKLLLHLIDIYNCGDWTLISKQFNNKSPSQCLSRYTRIKPGISKGRWTEEENRQLIDLYNVYGNNWSQIGKIIKTRTGKQIRDRYLNFYSKDLKRTQFSDNEDQIIINYYKQHGPQWTTIAKNLPGRTGDLVKNRFYSSLRKYVNENEYSLYLEHKRILQNKKDHIKPQSQSEGSLLSSAKLNTSDMEKKDKFVNINHLNYVNISSFLWSTFDWENPFIISLLWMIGLNNIDSFSEIIYEFLKELNERSFQ